MCRTSALASAIVALLATSLSVAGPVRAADERVWRLLSDTTPFPPMLNVPMGVYDPVRHRVLVIDMEGTSNLPAVVHVFESSPEPRWSILETSGTAPSRRYVASIVYDPPRDRLLLIGGRPFEVWALTLSGPATWQKLPSTGSPPIEFGHSTVYDAGHDRVILFGGTETGYPQTYSSNAWEYALATSTWSLLAPSGTPPGGREGHGAMIDPMGRRMIVFGGHYEAAARGFFNDLWSLSLDGAPEWTPLEVDGPIPGARSAFSTTYDPVRRRMLVHGGVNDRSGIEPDDLWALSLDGGPAWTKIATENTLRGRSYPVDVYDPAEDRLLACGGGGFPQASALSLAAPTRWSAVLPTTPLPSPSQRVRHALVHDTRRDRFVVVGGEYSTADSSLWRFDVEDTSPWTSESAPIAPSIWYEFEVAPSTVYDSLADRIIMFNGHQAVSTPAQGAAPWQGLGPPTPFTSYSSSPGAGVALDTRRHRLIVTGGWVFYPHSGSYTVSPVWALSLGDEPTWTLLGDLPQDWGSAGHAAFYDADRDELVVIGGFVRPGRLAAVPHGSTVWTTPLESTLEWTRHASPDEVPAPPEARAAYDSRSHRVLVFHGTRAWSRSVDESGPWSEFTFSGGHPVVSAPIVYDGVRDQVLALFAAEAGQPRIQAWAVAIGALSASLHSAHRGDDRVEIQWRSVTAFGRAVTVERREETTEWSAVGSIEFDPQGHASFEDRTIRPGHDYSYRLAVADGDSPWHSASIRLNDAASLRVALIGTQPSPAVGELSVAFSLPGEGEARLEIFDVRGRRCFAREIGALGPGTHLLSIPASNSWRPGVYFARLRRGDARDSRRIVLSR